MHRQIEHNWATVVTVVWFRSMVSKCISTNHTEVKLETGLVNMLCSLRPSSFSQQRVILFKNVKVRRLSLWETSWQENFWFQLFGNRIRSSFTSSAIFHSFFLLSAHLSFFPLLAVFCCWFQFFLSNNPHLIFHLKDEESLTMSGTLIFSHFYNTNLNFEAARVWSKHS